MPNKPVTWGKRILLILLVLFVIIQIVPKHRPDYSDITVDRSMAYMMNPPQEVSDILEVACYDCHSYATTYPWYSNIAPISFWIDDHVVEGRDHLNFAEWASYSEKQKHHKFEECVEEVKEGEMPIESYTWLHGGAKLSEAQRSTLAEWFQTQMHTMKQEKIKPESPTETVEEDKGENQ